MKKVAKSLRRHRPLILNWFLALGGISAGPFAAGLWKSAARICSGKIHSAATTQQAAKPRQAGEGHRRCRGRLWNRDHRSV